MYDDLVKSLRQCAEASCAGCKNDLVEIGCRGKLQREAADAIEELAEFCSKIGCYPSASKETCIGVSQCTACWLEWLKKEVE